MPLATVVTLRWITWSCAIGAALSFCTSSFAATMYLPYPYFVDSSLRLSNRVHLVVEGGALDMPLARASEHPNLPLQLRQAVQALSKNDSRSFASLADTSAFGGKPNAAEDFFTNISQTFSGMDDRRVAYWAHIDKVGLLVLSGTHQGKRVYPVLAFQSSTGGWKAIPGHRGIAFNVLMLWAAGLNLNAVVLYTAPAGAETTTSNIRGEAITVSFTKEALEGNADADRRFVQALKAASATEATKAAPTLPRAQFSPRSLSYLDKLSASNMRDYLKQLSETELIGRIALGESSLLHLRHVPSATVGPMYVSGPGPARVVTNVGHSSASDTVLISQENIDLTKRKAGIR